VARCPLFNELHCSQRPSSARVSAACHPRQHNTLCSARAFILLVSSACARQPYSNLYRSPSHLCTNCLLSIVLISYTLAHLLTTRACAYTHIHTYTHTHTHTHTHSPHTDDHVKHTILDLGVLKEGVPLHFWSGVVAGFAVAVTTSPVDTIRTRLMNQPVRTICFCCDTGLALLASLPPLSLLISFRCSFYCSLNCPLSPCRYFLCGSLHRSAFDLIV
jgi:hypothetical protein